MSLIEPINETRKELEEMLKDFIVSLPEGKYKLTDIKRESRRKYNVEFSELSGINKLDFSMVCNYNLDYNPASNAPMIISDPVFHNISYTENGDKRIDHLSIEIASKQNYDTNRYVHEFFINLAKMQQNEQNEYTGDEKRYELKFSILEK